MAFTLADTTDFEALKLGVRSILDRYKKTGDRRPFLNPILKQIEVATTPAALVEALTQLAQANAKHRGWSDSLAPLILAAMKPLDEYQQKLAIGEFTAAYMSIGGNPAKPLESDLSILLAAAEDHALNQDFANA